MPANRFRRTRILIDPDIQVRLSIRLAVCLLGYVMLFCVIALAEPLAVLLGAISTDLTPEAAKRSITHFSSTVLAPLLFAVACMILHGVLILHRLAGPVFRIRKAMSTFLGRDLTDRIHLRNKDYLVSLSKIYNHCSEQVRSDLQAIALELDGILDGELDEETRERALRADAILGNYRLQTDVEWEEPPADDAEEAHADETPMEHRRPAGIQ